MSKKNMLLAFILVVFFVLEGHTIPILVNVKESLEGYFPLFDYKIQEDVFTITAVWENVGSLTCDSYLRLKIITPNTTRDFWSEKQNVAPGGSGTYEVHVFLKGEETENITVVPYFYYCNEIEVLDNITLKEYNTTTITNFTFTSLNISYEINMKDKGIINITSEQNGTLYIIPKSPKGWILPTKKVKISEGLNTIEYEFYKPEKTRCCTEFLFVFKYSNTTEYAEKMFNLTEKKATPKEEKDINVYLFISITLNILLVVALLMVSLKRRKNKIFKKRDKNKAL